MTFCSIADREMLPHARVLAGALQRHFPTAHVVVVALDPTSAGLSEPFETLTVDEVAGPYTAELALQPGFETTAARLCPLLLNHAIGQGAEVAVYMGPALCVYDSFHDVLELASQRGVVVARRVSCLPDDDKRPGYADLLAAGQISPGFVAVARGEVGERFLAWWSRRLEEQDGGSARWLELAPDLFPSVAVLDDPGCNVSYWNLHERPLTRRGEKLLAAERPLRFVDFTGVRPDRPYWLNDAGTRVRVIDDPVLAELCGEYAERVRQAGWATSRSDNGETEKLGNGLYFDEVMRVLRTEAAKSGNDFGDLSTVPAAEAFASWLQEPAERGAGRLNRYLLGAYRVRPDLQKAFPDLDGADVEALIAWAWQHGRHELRLATELLPPPPGGLELVENAHLAVNVIGFLRETLGLAEAARLYVTALQAAGVPVATSAIAPELPTRRSGGKTTRRYGTHPHQELRIPFEPAFNLACVNGDHLDALVREAGEEVLGGRPTIGQWYWETDVLPPSWLPAFQHLEEVWVGSRFVAENLARLSPVPVVVIPPAVVVPDPSGISLEIAQDPRFTFMFMLDFFSTLRRKNAVGVVEAFTRAFAPGEGPRLLMKTINGRFRPEAQAELRLRMADRPDIELMDVYLEPRQIAALLARADCYVSLHRSEGFGLTLAESMALGTPVIATDYSGNTDFTTPQNSYLVDWTAAQVGPGCDVYPAEGRWADPDLDHAAELMRHVWRKPDEARAKAERARRDIQSRYAPQATGRLARARLQNLLDRRATAVPSPSGAASPNLSAPAMAVVDRELTMDLRLGRPPIPHGLKGVARRLVLRMMLPFTHHERNLDRAMAEAMRGLHSELAREQALRIQDRVRLSRLEGRLRREREK
ncbi:MAG: glycosyltransferase [Solirubrobacterales bacterium]|nr:glycosyltransferase [Solirubrobacterales bacterium]